MELRKGYKMTEVGVIPEEWEVNPLGDLAAIVSGGTPSTKVADYWDGNIWWCVPTDITSEKGNYLFSTARRITQRGLENSGAQLLPIGALLLCSRATIGDVKIAGVEICTNQGFKSLVCNGKINNVFLYYLVTTLKQELISKASGSTFLEVSRRDVAGIRIPVPPLPEQRAIAEALSDVDAMIGKLDQLIAKKRDIKQGAMQELLTGKRRLPGFGGKWEVRLFEEIVVPEKERIDPRRSSGPFFCVELEHIGQGSGSLIGSTTTDSSASLKTVFHAGDVLFGKLRAYLRKFWLADRDGVCSTEIWVFKSKPNLVVPQFLFYVVSMERFSESASNAYGTHMPRSDWSIVRNYEVSLPSLPEQSAIASILSDLDAELAALEQKRKKTRQLKQGMMQELLTGRIRLV